MSTTKRQSGLAGVVALASVVVVSLLARTVGRAGRR